MRQTVGALNRTWLAILGFLVLIAGALWLLVASGQAAAIIGVRGLAAGQDRVVGADLTTVFDSPIAAVLLALAGVVLVILGLVWIIAQIPRKNEAKAYRLQTDASHGITNCSPSVINTVVEEQIEGLPGVSRASTVLRGTSTTAELTVKMTAAERADIQDIIHRIRTDITKDLSTALEAPLRRLSIHIDVDAGRKNARSVTL
ncbi:alkaline shock response membrane anchor protein AmaP [Saxibacter everestensis]|uniref:Alkaline shock response membrane anchor protein AmaP n=1 Tax=Saxibacter everestensis TaxID=2909229 RepID=A0ABY8QTJ8_9MICO|nr:alkaline shock response membrane anchor protein AmaP [Brevibacteriaceae bacterium ZFBP1038]